VQGPVRQRDGGLREAEDIVAAIAGEERIRADARGGLAVRRLIGLRLGPPQRARQMEPKRVAEIDGVEIVAGIDQRQAEIGADGLREAALVTGRIVGVHRHAGRAAAASRQARGDDRRIEAARKAKQRMPIERGPGGDALLDHPAQALCGGSGLFPDVGRDEVPGRPARQGPFGAILEGDTASREQRRNAAECGLDRGQAAGIEHSPERAPVDTLRRTPGHRQQLDVGREHRDAARLRPVAGQRRRRVAQDLDRFPLDPDGEIPAPIGFEQRFVPAPRQRTSLGIAQRLDGTRRPVAMEQRAQHHAVPIDLEAATCLVDQHREARRAVREPEPRPLGDLRRATGEVSAGRDEDEVARPHGSTRIGV